jgi:hypothetical protein
MGARSRAAAAAWGGGGDVPVEEVEKKLEGTQEGARGMYGAAEKVGNREGARGGYREQNRRKFRAIPEEGGCRARRGKV